MAYNGYEGMMSNPYYRNPYQQPIAQPMQPVMPQQQTNMIQVNGIEGAKAYQMPANASIVLFDANQDVMYLKRTDGGGYPTIETFTFQRAAQAQPQQAAMVSVDEFNALRSEVEQLKEVINAKQPTRSRKQPGQLDSSADQ